MSSNISGSSTPQRIKSTFSSAGVLCAATLHLPPDYDGKLLPAILIIHGWGGIQEALTTPFCDVFAQAGFAVMTFDYPGWGDSQGLPRNTINPWQRVRDADAALAYLKSLPQVDTRKIILWGSSFGGGHTIELAAEHPSLLGAIAQVPMLDGLAAVRAGSLPKTAKIVGSAIKDLVSIGKPVYLPIVGPEGELSTMDRDDAYNALIKGISQAGISRTEYYDNRVTASSILGIGFYRPIKKLKNIKIPTLIIGGSRDSVAPFNEESIRKVKNPYISVHVLKANHFEPYFEPILSDNLAYQLKFLQSLLNADDVKIT